MVDRDLNQLLAQAKYLLFDIEGTLVPVTFVKEVLFPYAHKHLQQFVREQSHIAAPYIQEVMQHRPALKGQKQVVEQMKLWIETDQKVPALKALQGHIWEQGYRKGHFQAPVYPDVLPALRRWKTPMGIYSSGSIKAQKLLFSHTNYGDMTQFFSDYFDVTIGSKKSPDSYCRIAQNLGVSGPKIVFFSDVEEELDAGKNVGLNTIHVVRQGTKAGDRHKTVENFQFLLNMC